MRRHQALKRKAQWTRTYAKLARFPSRRLLPLLSTSLARAVAFFPGRFKLDMHGLPSSSRYPANAFKELVVQLVLLQQSKDSDEGRLVVQLPPEFRRTAASCGSARARRRLQMYFGTDAIVSLIQVPSNGTNIFVGTMAGMANCEHWVCVWDR
jgi:hypothetical protein